jgi:trans-2,3-dihydro-3-hydroxyanthranilate isomerase
LREYRFFQVDVFTELIFGGNPLAVFVEADGLSDGEMQQIARELNLSETAFVLPSTDESADVRVRFFTPSAELPFAGHPTIGTHVVLAQEGYYLVEGAITRIWQQVGIGVLPVDLIADAEEHIHRAVMTQSKPRFGATLDDPALLAEALGLHTGDIRTDLPTQVVSTGLPTLFVPLASLSAVQRIQLNVPVFNQVCRSAGVTGAEPFALETLDAAHHVHARNFGPLLGVYEDPATGSSGGALGAYLVYHGAVELSEPTTYIVIEQGYEINRPSLIEVEVDSRAEGRTLDEVRVGGQVVRVLEGVLRL